VESGLRGGGSGPQYKRWVAFGASISRENNFAFLHDYPISQRRAAWLSPKPSERSSTRALSHPCHPVPSGVSGVSDSSAGSRDLPHKCVGIGVPQRQRNAVLFLHEKSIR